MGRRGDRQTVVTDRQTEASDLLIRPVLPIRYSNEMARNDNKIKHWDQRGSSVFGCCLVIIHIFHPLPIFIISLTDFYIIQEAQLLLGDRATRKHAKGCWNGRGNDKLRWNELQMYFKVMKSVTNRKLVYDFLLLVYSNFCRITHRLWEIWCDTVPWPWNMPKVIDSHIIWKLSCGHVCKMFGRQWTNESKIAIFNDHTLIWRPLSSKPPRISA